MEMMRATAAKPGKREAGAADPVSVTMTEKVPHFATGHEYRGQMRLRYAGEPAEISSSRTHAQQDQHGEAREGRTETHRRRGLNA